MILPNHIDEFHAPKDENETWSETCWFSFAVPERKLSIQTYPFFRANLGVCSSGVYVWDDSASHPHQAIHSKNHWHLPIPEQPLSDIALGNGLAYQVIDPGRTTRVTYDDLDAGAVKIDVVFEGLIEPHDNGHGHVDQPGRVTGTVIIDGERIDVDGYGFHDRSWGFRSQHGSGMVRKGSGRGGYDYATAGPHAGFHILSMNKTPDLDEAASIHGYLIRDGEFAPLAEATRRVVERDAVTGFPRRVVVVGQDEMGRSFSAEGKTQNGLGFFLNPNMYSVNCLARWVLDGEPMWGEVHDNFSSSAARAHFGPGNRRVGDA